MRPRAIFLDLDGTLLDYDRVAWADTVRAVVAELGRAAPGIDPARLADYYLEISARHFGAAELAGEAPADGHAVWAAHWREALAECGQADEALTRQAVAAYERERGGRYRLFADVVPTLARLREQVSALVLITNGPGSTQRHKATALGLAGLVDAVIISGEAGVSKPDPAIFGLAAHASGVPLAAAWHVGDSLTSDVAGAVVSGLGAGVWLNRAGAALPATVAYRPDYEIASLAELPDLLAG
jgi:putative hydrolase of the HAD superfamily